MRYDIKQTYKALAYMVVLVPVTVLLWPHVPLWVSLINLGLSLLATWVTVVLVAFLLRRFWWVRSYRKRYPLACDGRTFEFIYDNWFNSARDRL